MKLKHESSNSDEPSSTLEQYYQTDKTSSRLVRTAKILVATGLATTVTLVVAKGTAPSTSPSTTPSTAPYESPPTAPATQEALEKLIQPSLESIGTQILKFSQDNSEVCTSSVDPTTNVMQITCQNNLADHNSGYVVADMNSKNGVGEPSTTFYANFTTEISSGTPAGENFVELASPEGDPDSSVGATGWSVEVSISAQPASGPTYLSTSNTEANTLSDPNTPVPKTSVATAQEALTHVYNSFNTVKQVLASQNPGAPAVIA